MDLLVDGRLPAGGTRNFEPVHQRFDGQTLTERKETVWRFRLRGRSKQLTDTKDSTASETTTGTESERQLSLSTSCSDEQREKAN